MASHFGQRRLLRDATGPHERRNPSPTSPFCSSAIWWEDREEQADSGDSLQEQLKAMDDHMARIQEMLKSEQNKGSRLQLRCNQQEAELRRKEQLLGRMKERLSDRYKDRAPSIKVLNTLTSAQGRREQLPSAKNLEDEAVLLMLERREAELREAMKLRHSLASLLHALRSDMEQTLSGLEGRKDETDGTVSVDKRLDQAERVLGEHVTGGVVQSWRRVQKRLGTFSCEGAAEFGTDHDKLIAQLEQELGQTQQLVQMQQQLLQDSIGSPVPPGDSYFVEEWDRLREHWAEFELQRRTFEREREAFTEAAIRLSHERQDFDQLKASLLQQQFLSDSPLFGKETRSLTRRASTDLSFSGIRPLHTPERTMALSPAAVSRRAEVTRYPSRVRIQTPSTPELYSALNLLHNPCRGAERDRTNPGVHAAPPLEWLF